MISKTISEVLFSDDDKIHSIMVRTFYGNEEVKLSLHLDGKMIGTGWKTTLVLAEDGDMISFSVNLSRGRCSYRTDILAKSLTEEVVRSYAEHALIQLLKNNKREDLLMTISST